jgi:hypothetical protein
MHVREESNGWDIIIIKADQQYIENAKKFKTDLDKSFTNIKIKKTKITANNNLIINFEDEDSFNKVMDST